jgi:hypothetical protein
MAFQFLIVNRLLVPASWPVLEASAGTSRSSTHRIPHVRSANFNNVLSRRAGANGCRSAAKRIQ